jgi:SagB-type dehydrogenase family enzyme
MKGEKMEFYREFLKDNLRQTVDFSQTDQNRGVPAPPVEQPCPADAVLIELPKPGTWRNIAEIPLAKAIAERRTHRVYRREALSLEELSFLLWATQGVRGKPDGGHAFRTVPSAGCRHALETHLAVLKIDGLESGIYRYLPLSHRLRFEFPVENLGRKMAEATLGQPFPRLAAVTFVWTAVPYRMEWRYGLASHKVIALDAGHVCQNLYLACEAIDAGTCAIAAYDQKALDALLRLDGREEFAVYLSAVGKKKEAPPNSDKNENGLS